MVLAVIPALIPDIPRIYDIYFAAFDQDEMGKKIVDILFPWGITDEFRKGHNKATLDWWHQSDDQYTFKCVDTETGDVLGMALADLVLKPKPANERVNQGVQWLEGEHKAKAEKILNPLWEAKNDLVGSIPHLYVHVIAVEPKHQGRKAGALLCQYGLQMSELLQLPLYIESSPTTFGLYKMFGFQHLERSVVHKGELLDSEEDITVPLMIRMPESSKGIKFEDWAAQGFPPFSSIPAAAPKETPKPEAPKAEVPKEEAPKEEAVPKEEVSAPKEEVVAPVQTLTENLSKAVGGEQNLAQLADLVSTIVLSKLPELLATQSLVAPASATVQPSEVPEKAAETEEKPVETEAPKVIDTKPAADVTTTVVQVTPTETSDPVVV